MLPLNGAGGRKHDAPSVAELLAPESDAASAAEGNKANTRTEVEMGEARTRGSLVAACF